MTAPISTPAETLRAAVARAKAAREAAIKAGAEVAAEREQASQRTSANG